MNKRMPASALCLSLSFRRISLLSHQLVKISKKNAFSCLVLSFYSSFLSLERIKLHFLQREVRFGECFFLEARTNADAVSNHQTTKPLSQRPMCTNIISCAETRSFFPFH